MKRFLLMLLSALPLFSAAQSAGVGEFFDRYTAAEGYTSVLLEHKMMELMSRRADERGDRQLARLLGEIRYIRIVALRGGDGVRLVGDAERAVAADGRFQLVTSSTEEGQTTKFYLRGEKIRDLSELVMITCGERETVVLTIYGSFDLKQVVRLSGIRPR